MITTVSVSNSQKCFIVHNFEDQERGLLVFECV